MQVVHAVAKLKQRTFRSRTAAFDQRKREQVEAEEKSRADKLAAIKAQPPPQIIFTHESVYPENPKSDAAAKSSSAHAFSMGLKDKEGDVIVVANGYNRKTFVADGQQIVPTLLGNSPLSKLMTNEVFEKIQHLRQLTVLSVKSCHRIVKITVPFEHFPHLTELTLSHNALEELPESVGTCCKHLRVLALDDNRLRSLPPSVSALSRLQVLWINTNRLREFPECVTACTALQKLNLRRNKIGEIPASIARLTSLTTLGMSNNKLSSVPHAIGSLDSLTELDLSHNRIAKLPPAMAKLSKLQILTLNDNLLEEIHTDIGHNRGLWSINLANNQLNQLPDSVLSLTQLVALRVENNPITELHGAWGEDT